MHTNYDAFLKRMIEKYEGGYCWDKGDAGGPTKYGVTCYDLAASRGTVMGSMAEWAPRVQAMSLGDAEAIFWTKYAVPLRFNDLPSGIDCAVMDYGVQSGVARVMLVMKRLLGLSPAVSYSTVMLALSAYTSGTKRVKFINDLCHERVAFMKAINDGKWWIEFGKGSSARVNDLLDYCLQLAQGQPTNSTPPDLSKVITPKAINHDPNKDKKTAAVASVGAIGSLVAAIGGMPWWWIALAVAGTMGAAFLYSAYLAGKAALANGTVHTSVLKTGVS